MNNWIELKVPTFAERIIGFSIPQENKVLAISYSGVYLLNLGSEITVETDKSLSEDDIYEPKTNTANYLSREYKIIGLYGGEPLLDGLDGERLVLDTDKETLTIVKGDKTIFSTNYKNFSSDWAATTFSQDKRFIILGCPYDFDFLVFKRKEFE